MLITYASIALSLALSSFGHGEVVKTYEVGDPLYVSRTNRKDHGTFIIYECEESTITCKAKFQCIPKKEGNNCASGENPYEKSRTYKVGFCQASDASPGVLKSVFTSHLAKYGSLECTNGLNKLPQIDCAEEDCKREIVGGMCFQLPTSESYVEGHCKKKMVDGKTVPCPINDENVAEMPGRLEGTTGNSGNH